MFVQISDLHISQKNNSRLITAFRQLKSNIDNLPIIIAGDVFNSKVRLSQDDILTFHTMVEIFKQNEIHIIPGNHDFVYGDSANLISTVITGTEYKNLRVYNKHSLVEIGESWFAFIPPCDYSPPDGIINELQGKPGAKYLVVHEPIIGSKYYTNSGYTAARINSNLLRVTAILAGDIHKHNVTVVNNTRIAFSGSLVQKNLSEIQDHGYLLWRNNMPEFYAIQDHQKRLRFYHKQNVFVPLKSGKYEEIAADLSIYLVFKSCSKSYIELVRQQMITEHGVNINKLNISEVAERNLGGFNTQIAPPASTEELGSLKTHLGLLTKTLIRDKKNNLIEPINKLHTTYYNSVFAPKSAEQDSMDNWSIQYLTWENMYCYGGDNCIDFSTLKGLSSIIGANGIGKSSVMQIILFGLFGEADDYSTICNVNATNWNVHIIISVGEYQYLIKRWGTKATKSSLTTNIALYKIESMTDICTNISAKTVQETQAILTKLIGVRQNFIDTNMIMQSHISYADATPASLTAALTAGTHFHLLKLVREAAEDQAKQLKKKIKASEEVLKGVKPHLIGESIDTLLTERESINQQLESVKDSMASMPRIPQNLDIQRYVQPTIPILTRDNLLKYLQCLQNNTLLAHDIPEMVENLKLINSGLTLELVKQYKTLNTPEMQTVTKIIGDMNVNLADALGLIGLRQKYTDESLAAIQVKCEQSIQQTESLLSVIKLRTNVSKNLLPKVTLDEKDPLSTVTLETLMQLNYLAHLPLTGSDTNIATTNIAATNIATTNIIQPAFSLDPARISAYYTSSKSSDIIKNLKWETSCTCCVANMDMLRQNITDNVVLTAISYTSALYTALANSLRTLTARKHKLANTFASGALLPHIHLLEDLVNNQKVNELQNLQVMKRNIEKNIQYDIGVLEKINYLPNDLQMLVDKIGIDGVRQKMQDLQNQNRALLTKLSDVSAKIGAVQSSSTLASSAAEATENIAKTSAELDVITQYVALLDPEKGIISELLTEYTNQLNQRVNTILSYLTSFQIKLIVEKKVIGARFEHNNQPISVASGAQRFIIDVAIRIALMQQSNCTSNLLIIDEGFGSLDTKHILQIQDFLKLLGDYYRKTDKTIIYISHIDELNEISQNKLSVSVGGTNQLSNISREEHNLLAGRILRYSNNIGENASSYANDIELRDSKPHCKYCDTDFKTVLSAEKHIKTIKHKNAFNKSVKNTAI